VSDVTDTVPLDVRVDEFYKAFAPAWGSMDVAEAVRIAREAGLTAKELEEYVREYASDAGISGSDQMDEIDVAGLAYEMVFERARCLMDDVLGIDIADEGYRVAANCVASCFDYEDDGCIRAVIGAMKDATPDQMRRIMDDRPTMCFLGHFDDLDEYMRGART